MVILNVFIQVSTKCPGNFVAGGFESLLFLSSKVGGGLFEKKGLLNLIPDVLWQLPVTISPELLIKLERLRMAWKEVWTPGAVPILTISKLCDLRQCICTF